MGDYGFIDIVLFAMIAAFLILRLRSVLGNIEIQAKVNLILAFIL